MRSSRVSPLIAKAKTDANEAVPPDTVKRKIDHITAWTSHTTEPINPVSRVPRVQGGDVRLQGPSVLQLDRRDTIVRA